MSKTRKHITVYGQAQGIGFRPFVWRVANEFSFTGSVYNSSDGVIIEIQGSSSNIEKFIERLKAAEEKELPLLKIVSLKTKSTAAVDDEKSFTIKQSDSSGFANTMVTADIATCSDCLNELFDKNDFRYRYPFINCTNCGPRYSIIKTVPYDRPNTTMSEFVMCDKCRGQYQDTSDRRFHAQPVACELCGPMVRLCDKDSRTIESDSDKAVTETVRRLLNGQIAAIKGLGGFHLACDAENAEAVNQLRARKMRDGKPFAMMAKDIESIKQFACVDEVSEKILKSIQAPIVLLTKREPNTIAATVAAGVNTFGFMLPYTPLGHLIFAEEINRRKLNALVMTSGNISDEPLICDDAEAFEKLSGVADIFLTYNRQIYRRLDDSVVHIVNEKPVLLRRARGFVPQSFILKNDSKAEIFAAGADLKNTFCLVKQNRFVVSEHIGDIEEASVYRHWLNSVEHLKGLLESAPTVFACDLHPGYLTSQYARKFKKQFKIHQIQHHWAHIASVLAENDISREVIGIAADGTGFGTDGAIWGCEVLTASLKGFNRFGHLAYYPLAGGDSAAKEAIRPLIGLIARYNLDNFDEILKQIEPDESKIDLVKTQIEKDFNIVQTSSLGRLFDAVSAVCGLGSRNGFEAQLPMALESAAMKNVSDYYSFEITERAGIKNIQIHRMLDEILTNKLNGIEIGIISAKFHNTVAQFLLAMAQRAESETGINTVVLSGGVFCNRYLLERLIGLLEADGFEVLFNRLVPSNDGGISLGQAAIASQC